MSDSAPQDEAIRLLAEVALRRAQQALRLAVSNVPHLSGLARLARLKASEQVEVAAVAASGLVLIQPQLFARLPLADAAFVLAHELMHLALDTHGRRGHANHLLVNFGHDYVINDMLAKEFDRNPPLDGLFELGAAEKSLEHWVIDLGRNGSPDMRCWISETGSNERHSGRSPSSMSRALAEAGLVQPPPPPKPKDELLRRGDLLSDEHETEFEPELSSANRQQLTQRVRQAAAKAAALATLSEKIEKAGAAATGGDIQREERMLQAIHDAYHTPWQLALQRWMDATAPGERTYARPSRRAGTSTEFVLAGRRREGWTLHIILDTSGSMAECLPRALGALAYFCEASSVRDIHIVQCDQEVTSDEWIDPLQLADYKVAGFGWSDMRPAMLKLADDPEVNAVLMLTDGYIDYLHEPPPYDMLWVLLGEYDREFKPAYGTVLVMET